MVLRIFSDILHYTLTVCKLQIRNSFHTSTFLVKRLNKDNLHSNYLAVMVIHYTKVMVIHYTKVMVIHYTKVL